MIDNTLPEYVIAKCRRLRWMPASLLRPAGPNAHRFFDVAELEMSIIGPDNESATTASSSGGIMLSPEDVY